MRYDPPMFETAGKPSVFSRQALRIGLPLAVAAALGFASGPFLANLAAATWDKFFYPAMVQVALSGIRWCM